MVYHGFRFFWCLFLKCSLSVLFRGVVNIIYRVSFHPLLRDALENANRFALLFSGSLETPKELQSERQNDDDSSYFQTEFIVRG